jgi:hypothetical protein
MKRLITTSSVLLTLLVFASPVIISAGKHNFFLFPKINPKIAL